MIKTFKNPKFGHLIILLAMAVMVLCPNTKAVGDETGKAKVTILVFSGRPNPVYWVEEDRLFGEIRPMLDKAAPNSAFKGKTVIPARLGYNGIIVETMGKKSGVPQTIFVYKNDIEMRNERVRFLKDDGAIESFLLKQALGKKAVDQKILDFIQSGK